MKLVECVPNFSEGRDKKILDEIAAAITQVKKVTLLDVDPGADTNRTVFTMVGEPEAIIEAAFQAIKKASELIDMSKHKGAHPRMGATDVCPLVPVSNITMEETVEYSKKLAKRVGEELGIPIYLYEYAATKKEWSNLAEIRKGVYEALSEKSQDPSWKPDFGPAEFNAKAGATAIGAREFLIAYNINLNSRNKKKANKIAKRIREKGYNKKDKDGNKVQIPGLFTNCKAVGWYIDEYNRAQISMNLTNYKITPPHIVLEKVRELAQEEGVVITGSELVGLMPKEALIQAGEYYLNKQGESTGIPEKMIIETAVQSMGLAELSPFDIDKKIIEYSIASQDNLVSLTLSEFADLLSTDEPAPGGGSVAALCNAISGSLTAMVSNLTFGKKKYKEHWEETKNLAIKGQEVKLKSLHAIDKDTDSFYAMMDAARLPKKTEEEKTIRDKAIQKATKQAIMVPLETLELSSEAVSLAKRIAQIGNTNAVSDAGVGAITAYAAARSAYYNVVINMSGITDDTFKENVILKAENLLAETHKISLEVEQILKNVL